MRLGIFGGSFDPVHNAHLALAATSQVSAGLDAVWFTPTAIQPLKHRGPEAPDADRVEMLRLAIKDQPTWSVCTLEVERGGLSYTVDSLQRIQEELPEAKLFFLMGTDVLRDVPQWKSPKEIFRLATPLVVRRSGQAEPDLSALEPMCAAENWPVHVEMPGMDISSSDIRSRVRDGKPIDDLVPLSVAEYIYAHGLYR